MGITVHLGGLGVLKNLRAILRYSDSDFGLIFVAILSCVPDLLQKETQKAKNNNIEVLYFSEGSQSPSYFSTLEKVL